MPWNWPAPSGGVQLYREQGKNNTELPPISSKKAGVLANLLASNEVLTSQPKQELTNHPICGKHFYILWCKLSRHLVGKNFPSRDSQIKLKNCIKKIRKRNQENGNWKRFTNFQMFSREIESRKCSIDFKLDRQYRVNLVTNLPCIGHIPITKARFTN